MKHLKSKATQIPQGLTLNCILILSK